MSALCAALNPIVNATQVINRADSSTIPKKIFIFLAYVVALFPTEFISNEQTCALLRTRFHVHVAWPGICHDSETTTGMLLTYKSAMNLPAVTVLIIDPPVANGRRDSILHSLRLYIVSGSDYSMLHFSCSDFVIDPFVREAKTVNGLISRGTTGLNCVF